MNEPQQGKEENEPWDAIFSTVVTALGLSFLSFSSAAAVTAVMNAAAVAQTTLTTAAVAAAVAERRKILIKAHILRCGCRAMWYGSRTAFIIQIIL